MVKLEETNELPLDSFQFHGRGTFLRALSVPWTSVSSLLLVGAHHTLLAANISMSIIWSCMHLKAFDAWYKSNFTALT